MMESTKDDRQNVTSEYVTVFDEIAEKLGGLGRFQIYVYFLACVTSFMAGIIAVIVVFLADINPHRCYIPACDSPTTSYEEAFVNFTVPFDEKDDQFDECSMFAFSGPDNVNDSMQCSQSNFDPTLEEDCQEWKYDTELFSSTVITSFDLVCDKKYLVPLGGSSYMFGLLIGSFASGVVSDRYGRRVCLILATLIFGVFGLATSLSPNYPMFVICRAITGGGGAAMFNMSFILGVELLGIKWRTFCGIMIEIPFALGETATGILAYFIRDWRWLQAVCTVPAFLLLSYYWLMPESVRWLVSQNRNEEAMKIIDRAADINKMSSPSYLINSQAQNEQCEDGNEGKTVQENSTFKLFKAPKLRKKTLILFYSWPVITLVYYGLSNNSGNLAGNIFINYGLTMLSEIPGYIVAYLLLDKIGRKGTMLFFLEVSGLACIVSGMLPADLRWLIVTFSLVGKLCIAGAFGSIFVYTAELFPTEYRSIGIGSCSTIGRIGGIIAPIIASLSNIYQPLPQLIFGLLAFIAGLTFFLLPETFGLDLPQTLEESENFGKDQDFWDFTCFKKKNKKELTVIDINEDEDTY